jgi:hypothetical protein
MDIIKVKKDDLLKVLKENRKKHKADYFEAVKAYRVKAADLFTKELEKIVQGEEFNPYINNLQKPTNHVKEYDLIIKMVEMGVDDIIKLQQGEFNQLVMDEWNWRSSFQSTVYSNTSYFGQSGMSGTSGTSGMSGSSRMSGTSGVSLHVGDKTFDILYAEDEIEDEEENDEE